MPFIGKFNVNLGENANADSTDPVRCTLVLNVDGLTPVAIAKDFCVSISVPNQLLKFLKYCQNLSQMSTPGWKIVKNCPRDLLHLPKPPV